MAEGQNLEDQENEMEALAALLPHEDEFKQLSPTSCIVRMVPFGERGRKDPLNRVMVGMRFEFTPDYPQEPPIWSFEDCKQRNDPPESMYDQMMNRKLASVDPAPVDEESEGSPSTPREDESRGPSERTLCAASVRAPLSSTRSDNAAKQERCTKQEFESWAAAFRTEMEERGIWKGCCARGVVTGRQLFIEDGLGIAAAADEDGADEPASKDFDKRPSGPMAWPIQAGTGVELSIPRHLTLVSPFSGAAFWSQPGLFGQDAKDLPSDD
ncbi:hypothetical protein Emag_000130 [Eimeria magna]